MSVIGGPNNPISNGLVYALDFKNNRCYVSGSNSAKSLLFNPTTASISAGFDNTTNTLIFSGSQNGTTNLTFPQVNYDKSFTISYVANIKNGGLGFGGNYSGSTTTLHTYFDTSSIRLGFLGTVTGFTGSYFTRTYPTSGNNQYTWVYTASGSFTLFVNGVPVSSSAANEGTTAYSGSDFKLSGRASDTFWSGSLGNVYIYNRALTNDEIRTNYTLASREYGLPTPPSFSIDENAYLFSQTAGITSSAYISALDTFVRGLKSASLWDKMVGIYPFLGGNNTLNQLNLKESSLTVYPASFTGSWSSSFSGSRSNTTASFATLTGLTPSTYYPSINTQSFHMAYLSYDTPSNSGSLMGATNQVIASGGQVFEMSGSRFHVFTASANLTVTQGGPIQAFVVAGGGGAGNDNSGGGGAGGVVYSSSLSITSGVIPATVGTGGLGRVGFFVPQLQGQNSTFGSVVAIGGGRGGQNSEFNGGSGGSGGGGGYSQFGGAGTPGQGTSGSDAGGGGGAGTSGSGNNGGSGSFYTQYASLGFGSPAGWFGGGGAGGQYLGTGGIGGGGAGGGNPTTGSSGSGNTGGGGGSSTYPLYGGSGGSGIIILSYPINTGSVLLNATPSDISGSINNTDVNGFFAGGPLGLVMTSRTGSRAYSVSKNKVIFNYTSSASSSISNNILLNAVNVNGTASFPSQNNVAYASVGAGLTNDESRTYYDLVDTFQTNLGRKNFNTGSYITMWDTRITGSGTTNSASVALYLGYGSQAFTTSWGDGTTSIISSSTQADRTHTYATPGRYLVSIVGTASFELQLYNPDQRKLLDIVQYGTNHISYGGYRGVGYMAYAGATNLVGTAADAPIISTPDTTFYYALAASTFRGNVDNWDTRNVNSLSSCFQNNSVFNQPVGNWNVEKVTSMENAFGSCTTFNNGGSTNINNWRPISCSNFNSMFVGANAFNQPIGNWPLSASNITLNGMFQNNISFNQNIGAWDVSRVSSMNNLFFYGGPFNNGGSPDINNWRPTSCTNFGFTFSVSSTFNQPLGNWVFSTSSTIDMGGMFYAASIFNQNLGAWNVEKVTSMNSLFYNSAFNNSGSTSINNWRPISCSNFGSMFRGAPFNQPIGNWPLSASSINMTEMFYQNSAFNQNLGSWNVEKVTNMSSMFLGATLFNNSGSNSINNWRPVSCSNFSNMFQSATAFNQPISNWPLSASNINMQLMFGFASAFNQDLGSWDVSRVTNMNYLFSGGAFNNSGSTSINNWRPISCSAFNQTFAFCSFNQPIGNWPLSASNIDMSYMFIQNASFNQPLATWDTSRVVSMNNMFDYATAFNQDLGSWNVGNVTTLSNFMATKSNYAYLHSIYDGWINNKLQPNVTASFGTNKYSGSAAEGRALLARTYNTASITGYSDDGGFMAITCSANHSVIVGNKVFISGSSYSAINGVETVLVAGSPTTLTLNTVYDPTATGGTIITGYGWSITDGGVV